MSNKIRVGISYNGAEFQKGAESMLREFSENACVGADGFSTQVIGDIAENNFEKLKALVEENNAGSRTFQLNRA